MFFHSSYSSGSEKSASLNPQSDQNFVESLRRSRASSRVGMQIEACCPFLVVKHAPEAIWKNPAMLGNRDPHLLLSGFGVHESRKVNGETCFLASNLQTNVETERGACH